jgi:hypothetical protein
MPIRHRSQGRPKGSKNKAKDTTGSFVEPVSRDNNFAEPVLRDKYDDKWTNFDDQFVAAITDEADISMAFMTSKEQADMELSFKLCRESIITTPGRPFEAS